MLCPTCDVPLTSPTQVEMTCPACGRTWKDALTVFAEKIASIRAKYNITPESAPLEILNYYVQVEQLYTEIIDELVIGARLYEQ